MRVVRIKKRAWLVKLQQEMTDILCQQCMDTRTLAVAPGTHTQFQILILQQLADCTERMCKDRVERESGGSHFYC